MAEDNYWKKAAFGAMQAQTARYLDKAAEHRSAATHMATGGYWLAPNAQSAKTAARDYVEAAREFRQSAEQRRTEAEAPAVKQRRSPRP